MSRTLGYIQRQAIEADIVAPGFLVSLTLLAPMFLSTRDGVTAMGEYWSANDLQIDDVSPESAQIKIYNTDYQYTMAALAGAFLRSPVRIHAAYGWPGEELPPYFPDGYFPDGYFIVGSGPVPATLLFDGYISDISSIDEWMTVRCRRSPPQRYPRRRIRSPFANALPSNGQLIEWQGETYRIES